MRKYKAGSTICTFDELLMQKVVYIFREDIIKNIEFVKSLQIRVVEKCIASGRVWKAEINEHKQINT